MTRDERRYKAEVKQAKRRKLQVNKHIADDDERTLGQLRDHHKACGCSICKPWKYGFEDKYKASELKKLGEDNGFDDI